MKRYIQLATLLLVVASAYAGLYRSIDKDGKVHYSDTPPPDEADYEELKIGKPPVAEEGMSYETRRAKENFPVTLYVFNKCGSSCDQAREFLNKRGIPFTEKNLVTKDETLEFYKISGGSEMPAMTVGTTWVKGFLDTQWNNELDIAGYPKTNFTYRAPQPAQPSLPKSE